MHACRFVMHALAQCLPLPLLRHQVVLCLMDTVDDTVLMNKTIIAEVRAHLAHGITFGCIWHIQCSPETNDNEKIMAKRSTSLVEDISSCM